MNQEEQKKLRRKIEDYLRKYATIELLLKIAALCGIRSGD